jgi:hypothetical protein
VNPDATKSGPATFDIAAGPSIDSIDPGRIAVGSGAFTLVVRGSGFASGAVARLNQTGLPTTFVSAGQLDVHVQRDGYTTGADGTFVLFFQDIRDRSQTVTLLASHPSVTKAISQDVTVQRGATVSIGIDMPS